MNRNSILNFGGSLSIIPVEGAIEVGKVWGMNIFVTFKAAVGNPFYVPAWGVKMLKATGVAKGKAKAAKSCAKPTDGAADTKTPEGAACAAETAALSEEIGTVTGGDAATETPAVGTELAATESAVETEAPPKKRSKKDSTKEPKERVKPTMDLQCVDVPVSLKPLKSSFSLKNTPDYVTLQLYYLYPEESTFGKEDVKLTRGPILTMLSKDGAKTLLETNAKSKEASEAQMRKAEGEKEIKPVAKCPKHLRL